MAFKAKYTITDKILNNISLIMTGREVIGRSRLIPKWSLKLRKEARLHNAHSSTSIEGNSLSFEQVKLLAEHKDVSASAKDKQEVINYLKALDAIPRYAAKKSIDRKLFLEIHKSITRKTLKDDKDCGNFRDRQVYVGKRLFDGTQFLEVVEYMPPKTRQVPKLIGDFLVWLNSEEARDLNPIILAAIAHYEVARIHPFVDGNGRTARLLASLILYKSGLDHRRFFALDDYYDQNRSEYYAALKKVQDDKGDLTRWLEYFTDGMLHSVEVLKELIIKLGFAKQAKGADQLELSPRQIKILEIAKEKGRITNKDLRLKFKISRQAILKEISKLVELKLIKITGKGRGAYYRISQ